MAVPPLALKNTRKWCNYNTLVGCLQKSASTVLSRCSLLFWELPPFCSLGHGCFCCFGNQKENQNPCWVLEMTRQWSKQHFVLLLTEIGVHRTVDGKSLAPVEMFGLTQSS